MSTAKGARKTGKREMDVTADQIRETVSERLRRKLQFTRHVPELLARKYGWSPRKARSVWAGDHLTATDLVRLMAGDDEVFQAVCEMTGRNDETRRMNARAIEQAEAVLARQLGRAAGEGDGA